MDVTTDTTTSTRYIVQTKPNGNDWVNARDYGSRKDAEMLYELLYETTSVRLVEVVVTATMTVIR